MSTIGARPPIADISSAKGTGWRGLARRLAVLGICGATDEQLRVALFAARGGALRHLTAWPGSYTAIVQVGRRITVCGDLAGARPVFHTPWAGGTAYATAALPLADLIEANLDFGHLAALLAAPDVPAAAFLLVEEAVSIDNFAASDRCQELP